MLWKKLEKLNCQFPENVYGVTSTGPCPAETINSLRGQGLARMTEVYGSSETGGVGFRHDPADMYTLLGHWEQTGNSTIERTSAGGNKQQHTLQDNLEWQGTKFKPLKGQTKPSKLMRPEEGERLKAFIVTVDDVEYATLEKELRTLAAN
ncbi:AMP-binding protein, partial [Aduncisulcus paluster]